MNPSTKKLIDFQNNGNSIELIDHFNGFIETYVKFIQTGFLDTKQTHLRYFVCLFLKDSDARDHLKQNKGLTESDWHSIRSVIKYIKSYFYFYTKHDTYTELLIPFLKMAKKFVFDKLAFDAYTYYNYNLSIVHYLRELTREPNDYAERMQILDGELGVIVDLKLLESHLLEMRDKHLDVDVHDLRFMRGDELSGVFSEMTNVQRYILVYYYVDGLNDREISEKLGLHKRSVYRARNKLVNQLKEMLLKGEIKCLRKSSSFIKPEVLLQLLEKIKN